MTVMCEGKYSACIECSLFSWYDPMVYGVCPKTQQDYEGAEFCEYAFEYRADENLGGKRKTGRAYRRKAKFKNDTRRFAAVRHARSSGAGFVENRSGKDYIVYPKHSKAKGFFKRYDNKRVRRYNGELGSGNRYKRI